MVIKLKSKHFIIGILVLCLFFSMFSFNNKHGSAIKNIDNSINTVDLPVIMYHHLLKSNPTKDEFIILTSQFKKDIAYLEKNGYNTVSMSQILDFTNNNVPLPPKPILITFDDGYLSVYKYAYPILKKKNMKAVALVLGHYTDLFSTDTPKGIKYANLSWDELKEMQDSGVFEIGNHSYNLHFGKGKGKRYGTKINNGEDPKQYIESVGGDLLSFNKRYKEMLNKDCISFAYPFGAISKELTPFLNDNFKFIFTCDGRNNKLSYKDELPLILKRHNRSSKLSTEEFFAQIC